MTEPRFDLPPKAPPEVVEKRQALAEQVCRELRLVGFTVYRGDLTGGPHYLPGVDVHVTPFVDGGVYADWHTDAELRGPALELYARGIDYANPPPALRHYQTVLGQMRAVMTAILASAGFEVEEPDGHAHGSMVQVTGFRP
ncbi:hypothetical protein OG223_31810 [Streptomyces sp. NBC_01478]|uniref:hypothetical protein n=1 Tax=Streptomyces sp. NBC_01478 TaxID=2903882 RepID=UPI002E3352C4|nr:hypothetical protein [Streptomyces sp. NBC_01478]